MRAFIVILKILGWTLAALLLAAAVLAVVVLRAPQWIVNDRSLAYVKESVLPRFGIAVDWRDGSVKVENLSSLEKRISFAFRDLTYDTETVAFGTRRATGTFDLSLRPRDRWLTGIGPLDVAGGRLTLTPAAAPEEPIDDKEPMNLEAIARFFEGRRIEPVSVSLDEVAIAGDEGRRIGALAFVVRKPAELLYTVEASLTGQGPDPLPDTRLAATVRLVDAAGAMTPAVEAHLQSRPAGGKLDARLVLEPPLGDAESRRRIGLEAQWSGGGTVAGARLDGIWRASDGRVTGGLEARLDKAAGTDVGLVLRDCEYTAQSADYATAPVRLDLSCQGQVGVPRATAMPDLAPFLPRTVAFSLAVGASLQQGESEARRVSFTSTVSVPRVTVAPLVAQGTFGLEGRVSLAAPTAPEALLANLDFGAEIGEFAELVKRLRGTKWPVPAPLNQLTGNLSCSARGQVDLVRESARLPFRCETRLLSAYQRIITSTDAALRLVPIGGRLQPQLDARFSLQDVALTLPDLNLRQRGMPRMVADNRIGVPVEEQVRRVMPLAYDFRVVTTRPDSLRLTTELATQPVPITVDLAMSSERGMGGAVALHSFDLELLRRTAHVRRVEIKFEPGQSAAELAGRVDFEHVDYKIFVDIMGTTAKPQFVLQTEPPVPEREAMAMLLFGRSPELLDEDAMRTAEETRAAIADSAIGLVTMYYLASTPIESIGYNPLTGVVTARVALQEGLTLEVGGGEDVGAVGLRRRLGRNWAIETRAETSEAGGKGQAMLRWGLRY